ncbi:unannotated protein [freshwater metagenome]|uniref:Unannotated protein n=1 Tax=freshwater metagenome TaxID=449393 RepID=A0A6J7HZG4_9ZZZZ
MDATAPSAMSDATNATTVDAPTTNGSQVCVAEVCSAAMPV